MSHIFLPKDQKKVLKAIIFNLINIKQSDGHIFLTKRKHTKTIFTPTFIPKDVVKIICDYDEEVIKLSIFSIIQYCKYKDNALSFLVRVKLEHSIDVIFDIRYCSPISSALYIYNVMTNIFNFYCYNTTDDNELLRKRCSADDTLLTTISRQLTHINEQKNMFITLKNYNLLDKYENILNNIKHDDGVDYNISNNLSLTENKKNKWIYDYNTLNPINNYHTYGFYGNITKNIDYIDISHFFNKYIQQYYGKLKYFNKHSINCIVKNNNIFVHKLDLGKDIFKLALIYPLNHKKLKNIIVIMKVIQFQLINIMNEIVKEIGIMEILQKRYLERLHSNYYND